MSYNTHLNVPVHDQTAELTFHDVIHYAGWKRVDSEGKRIPIIPQRTNTPDFQQIFVNNLTVLDQRHLVEVTKKSMEVSKLGQLVLESLVVKETI